MVPEDIKKKIMCAGWDIEYWENYMYQLKNGLIHNFGGHEQQKEILYCNNKLEETNTKLDELKMKYAEYLI